MTNFIEIWNISSQLPLYKWDCPHAYFSDFKFRHACSILLTKKVFREFHWQNDYQTFVSEQHSCMDCFTISCFTEDCWLLTSHSSPVLSLLSDLFVFFFSLYSFSITHITLPIYLKTASLLPHPLNILPLFWVSGFFSPLYTAFHVWKNLFWVCTWITPTI